MANTAANKTELDTLPNGLRGLADVSHLEPDWSLYMTVGFGAVLGIACLYFWFLNFASTTELVGLHTSIPSPTFPPTNAAWANKR